MALARIGVSVWGSRTLAVRGRTSGEWRTVPVNLLEHDGARYLVAPRGETQWVRNLRVAGTGELRLGPRREIFRAREIPDSEKPAILRAYLRKWAFEVNQFFQGVGADAPGRRDPEDRAGLSGLPDRVRTRARTEAQRRHASAIARRWRRSVPQHPPTTASGSNAPSSRY